MSKRKSRPYTTAAIILVGGTLVAFFLYMWNYDYKVSRPKEFTLKRDLRGMLRIDQKGEFGYAGPVAIITLANASQGRVRMLDTKNLQPLYALKLVYKTESGETKELSIRPDVARRLAREESEPFDKENDAVAELVTGAAYTRAIPLAQYYDIKEPGNYELTVTYNPEKVAQAMGQSFDFLDVTREVLSVPVKFRYPEETAPVNAEKVEKAEKTPSINITEK